jgi:hypothetical protein
MHTSRNGRNPVDDDRPALDGGLLSLPDAEDWLSKDNLSGRIGDRELFRAELL